MPKNLTSLTITIALGIIVLLFGIAFPIIFSECYVFGLEPNLLGDYLGGTSGTIITLGTAVLLFANYLQQKNINNEQKKEISKRENELKIERFESHFFQLLNLNANHLNSMQISVRRVKMFKVSATGREIPLGTEVIVGRNCFTRIYDGLKSGVYAPRPGNTHYDYYSNIDIEERLDVLREGLKVYDGYLGYYFNNIESQISLLNTLCKIELQKYIKTFKNQFSAYELVLILYYSQCSEYSIMSKFFKDNNLFIGVNFELLFFKKDQNLI